jgi:hypothetical protein
MDVEIGTGATKFLFWEYLFRVSGIVSLKCEYKILKSNYGPFNETNAEVLNLELVE